MPDIFGQLITDSLLAAVIGLGLACVFLRRRSYRRQAEIQTLTQDLMKERATFALAVTNHSDVVAAKNLIVEKHASQMVLGSEALRQKNEEVRSLSSRIADLDTLEARVCELTLALANKEQEVAHLNALEATTHAQLETMQSHAAELEGQLAAVHAQAAASQAKLAEWEPLVAETPAITLALAAKERELKTHVAAALHRETVHAREIVEKDETLETLTSKIEQQALLLAEQNTQLRDLRADFEASQTERETLRAKLAELEPLDAEFRADPAYASIEQALAERRTVEDEFVSGLRSQPEADTNGLEFQAQLEDLKVKYQALLKASEPRTLAAAAGAASSGTFDYDEGSVPEIKPQTFSEPKNQVLESPTDARPRRRSISLPTPEEVELRQLRDTVETLLGPLEPQLIASLAAQMHTGSDLENWLLAERTVRLERLEHIRLERQPAVNLF